MFINTSYTRERPIYQPQDGEQHPHPIFLSSFTTSPQTAEFPPLPILYSQEWDKLLPLLEEVPDPPLPRERRNALSNPAGMGANDNPNHQNTPPWYALQTFESRADITVDDQHVDIYEDVEHRFEQEWNDSLVLPGQRTRGPVPIYINPTTPEPSSTPNHVTSTTTTPSTASTSITDDIPIPETLSRTQFSRPLRRSACSYCRRRKKRCSAAHDGPWPCTVCLDRERDSIRVLQNRASDSAEIDESRIYRAKDFCFTEETPAYLRFMVRQPKWKGAEGWEGKRFEMQLRREREMEDEKKRLRMEEEMQVMDLDGDEWEDEDEE